MSHCGASKVLNYDSMLNNEKLASLHSIAAKATTNSHAVTKDTIDALLLSLGTTSSKLKAESLQ
jgi:hypothetical protein